jgi:hypothetical protein
MVFLLERKDKEDVGHARNMLHLVDDKYEIDGIYFFDPTFDCKKDEGNNFLFSYRFFAKDYIEMDELSGGIYVPREFKLFDEDNFDDFLALVEDLPGNLQLAFRLLTHYRLTFLLSVSKIHTHSNCSSILLTKKSYHEVLTLSCHLIFSDFSPVSDIEYLTLSSM